MEAETRSLDLDYLRRYAEWAHKESKEARQTRTWPFLFTAEEVMAVFAEVDRLRAEVG